MLQGDSDGAAPVAGVHVVGEGDGPVTQDLEPAGKFRRDEFPVREQCMRVQVNHAEGPAVLALRRPDGHSRPLSLGRRFQGTYETKLYPAPDLPSTRFVPFNAFGCDHGVLRRRLWPAVEDRFEQAGGLW